MSWKVYGTNSTAKEEYNHPLANLTDSAPSALFGHPAADVNDWYIIRGLARLTGIPDGAIDPANWFPFDLHPPPGNPSYTSRGPSIIGSAAAAISLVLTITTVRLSLRYFRHDLRFGWDDFVIIPAALGVCTWFALSITSVILGGSGQHMYYITYTEIAWFFKIAQISQPVYWMAVGPVKISIALFNRRLTGLTTKRWMRAHNIFLALLVSYVIAAVFICVFDCVPFENFSMAQIGKAAEPQRCLDLNTMNLALASIHIATDFSLLCVPIIVLYKMQMSVTKKLRLGFLFSIGSVACIGSVMRMVVEFQADPDITWASQKMFSWITVDLFFAVTAASLPVLNAAVPKGWRSPNSIKPLGNLSLLEKGTHPRSQTAEGQDLEWGRKITFGRDGTIPDVEKDSFHKKIDKRWDDAYAKCIKQPEPVWAVRQPVLDREDINIEGRGSSESEGRASSNGLEYYESNSMHDAGPSDTSNSNT